MQQDVIDSLFLSHPARRVTHQALLRSTTTAPNASSDPDATPTAARPSPGRSGRGIQLGVVLVTSSTLRGALLPAACWTVPPCPRKQRVVSPQWWLGTQPHELLASRIPLVVV